MTCENYRSAQYPATAGTYSADLQRYYTMRLGLLPGRYLNSDFSLTEARILYELAQGSGITAATLRRTLSWTRDTSAAC